MTTRPHHAPAFITTNVSQTDHHQESQRRVTMKGACTSTITSLVLAMVLTTPALADEPFAQGAGEQAGLQSATEISAFIPGTDLRPQGLTHETSSGLTSTKDSLGSRSQDEFTLLGVIPADTMKAAEMDQVVGSWWQVRWIVWRGGW